ncbi:3-ketoacyl-CoA thiolase, peroxisomal [Fulvia fulva]|uniref:acetyl-CoA C-acyltransferase n=1 Tax=Passalora fulva TaxID=5499 RepID=A0A9Q8PD58_PASFU|nr:3-ketoacyl-CoA thiolase, peroxisomal [Fulvia fulva]KAK4620132.1 3-ketoacyl-CoA thiolase, peroxisomal [Fulvia fulva]KAK4620856.1 3-ketoacyl-CoA thiolase, peroxisomal [Fulvia fulva]UJO20361.1 3-ketoacyl-CoA thiolase, peroxisomal [Fulvia fulva]WPV17032.1 3-ketoacyl-CoA thiolase, peroxisomal [Fulvia fulva]WPV32232.1 3-ketoacyl-CoA thiolase, peroxisomal [Fulvia fulva]
MAGFIQKGTKSILQKNPNDIVFLSALRTPVTRAKKGGFKDAHDHELLAHVLKATLAANTNLDPAKIDDVQIGTVLSELGGSKAGRMAACHVCVPITTSVQTVNRACSSGLAAITGIANAIAVGQIDVGIGGGMESMTRNYGSRAIPTQLWDELRNSPVKDAKDCIMSMGITAENVAERYGVSRADQDAFAASSHLKAAKAQKEGLFDKEIVAVTTRWHPNPENPETTEEITVTKDDGIRPNSSPESLAKMKPAFKETGTATAGNSSQVSDGAAATLMMRRSTATELGLTSSIIGKWAGTQVIGCKPDEMGIGPALAIPKLLDYTGVDKSEIGIWEINEAFASQAIHCVRTLGIDESKVNPKGGAIALGHPLGATGARQLATLLPELERQGQQLGVVSMCIGTGMGMASLIVRE